MNLESISQLSILVMPLHLRAMTLPFFTGNGLSALIAVQLPWKNTSILEVNIFNLAMWSSAVNFPSLSRRPSSANAHNCIAGNVMRSECTVYLCIHPKSDWNGPVSSCAAHKQVCSGCSGREVEADWAGDVVGEGVAVAWENSDVDEDELRPIDSLLTLALCSWESEAAGPRSCWPDLGTGWCLRDVRVGSELRAAITWEADTEGKMIWELVMKPYLSEVDRRAECRRQFYQGVAIKSGRSWSWRWSPSVIAVKRRFGFSLCAAPPRSFFVLIYEGSVIN